MSTTISTPVSAPGSTSASIRGLLRQVWVGLRLLLILTVVCGLLYPAAILVIGRVVPGRTDGQLVSVGGKVVGSAIIGQTFDGAQWFASRPSAAGKGYDPLASGASNLGQHDATLLTAIEQRRAAAAAADGVQPSAVPNDAVTASGSGLDPDISPAYAAEQVDRVAKARGLRPAVVSGLVAKHTQGRALGFLGEPRVNVLELNIALQKAGAGSGG